MSGQWVQFGRSTIERWYYAALGEKVDPVKILRRKIRSDHGKHPAVSPALSERLAVQYRQHPSWSYQLHADNLAAAAEQEPALGRCPSYACLARFMKGHGLIKRPRRGRRTARARQGGAPFRKPRNPQLRERVCPCALAPGLPPWVAAGAGGGRPVGVSGAARHVGRLFAAVLPRAVVLPGGGGGTLPRLSQAFEKRAIPRALMTDHGGAMVAAETQQGLSRLSVVWEDTLPYSPNQNGKQESWWGQIEGRLLPMLEGVADLTLAQLNAATQAWVEMEYNRRCTGNSGRARWHGTFRARTSVGRARPEKRCTWRSPRRRAGRSAAPTGRSA